MVKIFVNILLSVLILSSSTGVSFYKHYCSKSNEHLVSLSNPVSCNNEMPDGNSCEGSCGHEQKSVPFELEKSSCCVDYISFIKIDHSFIESINVNLTHHFIFAIILNYIKLYSAVDQIDFLTFINLPPVLYNRGMLSSICTFLL
jgi:hypothetical protein